jgi:tetratricopeptide (TPR) repeat protein
MAPNAATDPKLRERKITKVDLIRDAVSRLDDFLTVWPDDPAADQASFSLASALVELEAWPAAIERSNRFAERFTKSEYLDSFWYIVGYAHFARGEHRAALDMCRRVAEVTHKDPVTGRAAESKNKWRAIYISGQVHHSLGEPGAAIAEYTRVADRFPDAKETIDYFTRKSIELPEITAVKPPGIAGAQGDPAADQPENKNARVEVELKFRNVASCEVKVYRIDLLKFGLLQRDLANITRINLAGIKPLYEAVVELGDGKDYRDRTKKLELPLREEGAYLVVTRGEDLHTSGLVLVTPLVVEVQEEASSGRVRATVKNSVTETYTSDVHVKVIGTRNDKFKDGATDLRGVFVADGILGRATVIARAGTGQYAFHRGQQDLGPPPAQPGKQQAPVAPSPAASEPGGAQQELLKEVFQGNRMIQEQKGKELQNLYDKKNFGVPAQQAF